MTSPSAICTINGTTLAITGTTGINVSGASTITVALANTSGVGSWSISATNADDTAVSNGTLTAVNNSKVQTGFSATFVMPVQTAKGSAFQFTSVVNHGLSNENSITLGVWVLGTGGARLFFGGQTTESNATVGNVADLNTLVTRTGTNPAMPNLTNLRARTGLAVGEYLLLDGYAASGDGGGGHFIWSSDTSTADDNGLTIVPTGTRTGCWKRVYDGAISVKWFGAKGDGVTNDAPAINAAIVASRAYGNGNGGGHIYLPQPSAGASYRVATPVLLYAGTVLEGSSGGTVNYAGTLIATTADFVGDAVIKLANRQAGDQYGIVLRNFTVFVGTRDLASIHTAGIDMSGMRSSSVENVAVTGFNQGANPTAGLIGFLFTDSDGAIPEVTSCYFNQLHNVSTAFLEKAFVFRTSTIGGCGAIVVSSFLSSESLVTLTLESHAAQMGLTFINGYIVTWPGAKHIEYIGDSEQYLDCLFENVEWDSAGNPTSDIITSAGTAWLGLPSPDSGVIVKDTLISSPGLRRIVFGNELSGRGHSRYWPALPAVEKGSASLSFWASIPKDTALTAGVNTFKYYTSIASHPNADVTVGMVDFGVNIDVSDLGGLVQPHSWACDVSLTNPPGWGTGYRWTTYTVTLIVGTNFTLTSDLVFFVDTVQSAGTNDLNRIQSGASVERSGVVYDWDADNASHSGGLVTTWTDSVGGKVLTSGSPPSWLASQVNGHAAVVGDGSSKYLATTTSFAIPGSYKSCWEVYIVMKQIAWTNNHCILSDSVADRPGLFQAGTTPQIQMSGSSPNVITGDLAVGSWGILRCRYAGDKSLMSVNDGTLTYGNTGVIYIANGFNVMRYAFSGAAFANIAIAKIMIADPAIHGYIPGSIMAYLRDRYAL